jgi:integrase
MTLKKLAGVYHVGVPSKGKNKYISTGSSNKDEAVKVVKESGVDRLAITAKAGRLTRKAIGQILTGKNLTCSKALEEYQQVKLRSKAPKTVANNVLVIRNWLKDQNLETTAPSAVTGAHIDKWINNPDSNWKRTVRQISLSSVRNFFDFMFDKGWIVENPAKTVALDYSAMSHEQKEQTERLPFTEDEVKLLLSELRKDWRLAETGKHTLFKDSKTVLFWLVAVTIGKETGLRISDIAQLEWRSFSEPGKLVVWTDKTNQRVEHKISEAVQNVIAEIPVVDAEYLFPEECETARNVMLRAKLPVHFGRLCQRIGIEGKSFHSLRHYKATNAYSKLDKDDLAKKLAASLSLEQIAGLLGHANKKTTKGYVHE